MNCQNLAAAIERLQPAAAPRDVARLCLLLANMVENLDRLEDDRRLADAWQEMGLRLQAATDQHAAMTDELEHLAQSDPRSLAPEQIWILIRAIKVQSQILQLYLGQPQLECPPAAESQTPANLTDAASPAAPPAPEENA